MPESLVENRVVVFTNTATNHERATMNVALHGGSTIRGLLENRLVQTDHRLCALEVADLIIDCGVSSSAALFHSDARVLALCYASSATMYASRSNNPTQVTGFSVVPTKTGLSLIELTQPLQGNAENLEFCQRFFESLGLETIIVPDSPGLIVARTVACLANEAFSALATGIADAQTIDTAMKLGVNYPLGPLEWAELIGLEGILAILEGLQSELGERYRPHPVLRQLVAANLSIAAFEQSKRARV
jgi:3-hydroxybutyryl-CoA dehydrogenase